jgi:hypothetical protein
MDLRPRLLPVPSEAVEAEAGAIGPPKAAVVASLGDGVTGGRLLRILPSSPRSSAELP